MSAETWLYRGGILFGPALALSSPGRDFRPDGVASPTSTIARLRKKFSPAVALRVSQPIRGQAYVKSGLWYLASVCDTGKHRDAVEDTEIFQVLHARQSI